MRGAIGRTIARFCAAATLACGLATAQQPPPPPTVFIVDASNSMSAALDGVPRLDTARSVLNGILAGWQADAPLGLIAYGHRRVSDCDDIEVLAPIGKVDPPVLAARLEKLRARGKTPLSSSIERAAGLLKNAGAGGTIILLTDGIETCRADPCAVAAAVRAANAAVRIYVIGFAVEAKDEEQLSCIAKAGGGDYRTAADAPSLIAEMNEAAAKAVAPPPEPAPAPEPPKPEPPKPEPLPAPEPLPVPEPEPTPVPPPAPAPQPPAPAPDPPRIVQISFVAVIKGEGPLVDHPADWTIAGLDGNDFSYAGSSRGLGLQMKPGRYRVEVRASNAAGTKEITVGSEPQTVEIELPAGRLTTHAVPYAGAPPLDETQGLVWTLEPLDGQGAVVAPAIAQPSWLLATGRYRLTVTRGVDRASEDVVVAPGKPQDIVLSLKLGQLKVSAAASADGEPLTDWEGMGWRVLKLDGSAAAAVKNEAQPLFSLPQGEYTAELAIAGAVLSEPVEVSEGKTAEHRFVVPTGRRVFTASLGPGAPTLTDWRDTYWTVKPIKAAGLAPDAPPAANSLAAVDLALDLMPGRWSVSVQSGLATASGEIEVAPRSTETIHLDLQAARLTLSAAPESGSPPANIVFEIATVGADGTAGEPVPLGGTSSSLSSIVPAGRWRILASDEQQRTATADIELKPGEETSAALVLK